MIGIIILISLLICALCLLIALLYIRQTEIEVKDKSVDLESVLPIQTITENAVINGNGDITVGYRLLLPEVFTLSESEAQYIHERLEALLKLLPAGTVIHQQNFYYTGRYHHAEYSVSVSAMLPLFFKQEYLALSSKKDESRNSFPPYSRSLQGTFA